ncbi:hypothetical protein KAH81_06385 [bacterium]|nr:hypothetical protein [bacterium]
MKNKFFILFLILFASAFASDIPTSAIVKAWKNRNLFSADITQNSISPIDTLIETGNIAIRKPDAIFKTKSELIIFKSGRLYTYTTGSDVGMVSTMESFAYADVSLLISELEMNFMLKLAKTDIGYNLTGINGTGNIVSFSASLDEQFIPKKITWIDLFGYITEITFENISIKDKGQNINVPKDIEFLE